MRVAAIAAVVLICLGMGLAFLANEDQQKLRLVAQSDTQIQPSSPETTITENGVTVSSSGPLMTDRATIRELLINGRHRLVMNRDTSLSFAPLVENGKFGCRISLRSGQISAHVDHDGNPFVVRFPHGSAVITGTTFDIKVTEHETSLVVAEGSVRFASDQGEVQVNAGHRSTLKVQAEPTEPVACDVGLLMAWAGERENMASVAATAELELDKLLEEIPLPLDYPSGPIALESLDYDEWVESKREWFKVQFPWIFELQETLKEKVLLATDAQSLATTAVPDYPELLLQTGDIWQIVYPHRFYRRIPVIQKDSLSGVAERYQLDSTWLDQVLSEAARRRDLPTPRLFCGEEALNQWLCLARDVERDCDNQVRADELCEYCLVNSEYLENSRNLLWLCIKSGKHKVGTKPKTEMLQLLQQQVAAAHTCKKAAWHLNQLGTIDNSTRQKHHREIFDAIVEIIGYEERIKVLNAK